MIWSKRFVYGWNIRRSYATPGFDSTAWMSVAQYAINWLRKRWKREKEGSNWICNREIMCVCVCACVCVCVCVCENYHHKCLNTTNSQIVVIVVIVSIYPNISSAKLLIYINEPHNCLWCLYQNEDWRWPRYSGIRIYYLKNWIGIDKFWIGIEVWYQKNWIHKLIFHLIFNI